MSRKKVSIIGAGHTGSTLASIVAQNELADVVLIDRPQSEKSVKGKALDILESGPVFGFDVNVTGTTDYSATENSDVVVITAGSPRKPGMSRDDLVQTNEAIMKEATEKIVKYSPNCTIIVLTNPVDAMTYVVQKVSCFPKSRVLGQSGVLDTARFNTFVAASLEMSTKDVTGLVLGGHGDTMVPIISHCNVNGVPLVELLDDEAIKCIVERTQQGGAEIVSLLETGSAYYAPAAAVYEMMVAIIKDQNRVLPAIAYLEGEYGYNDICLGVPTILGAEGVKRVVELKLTEEEQKQLDESAASVEKVKSALTLNS
ncbi:malate dehydrogenase [Staphylococcus massiliensis]|uniref:Malate dehydrogenase n=1 Tax=Staphylococcus massiliensis S46 TaxID=1229783 RepID=K9AMN8_9STAP|nr:malate dehydrogenase [Staphylococcus massiliensis]EKU48584.1 malate dehydrogenase [Staphylococcus massiliensis S46]MCG3400229.1 malate dehydrogenase [Staphylococcus massiliensis]MCG3413112.1 malate dehydrogenase [Staphylococcus massiliensis]PNZ98475.1 malate dehydrogenase [Staphylococcus massiliensis CCUG 55927]